MGEGDGRCPPPSPIPYNNDIVISSAARNLARNFPITLLKPDSFIGNEVRNLVPHCVTNSPKVI